MIDEIRANFAERFSPQHTAIILRIYKILFEEIPNDVYQLRRVTIGDLMNCRDLSMMQIITKAPIRQRTDLDFFIKMRNEEKVEELNKSVSLLLQLAEIEMFLSKITNKPFQWFEIADIEVTGIEEFVTNSQYILHISITYSSSTSKENIFSFSSVVS